MKQVSSIMDMQDIHPVVCVSSCVVVIPTVTHTKSHTIAHTGSLCGKIGCPALSPRFHIHVHSKAYCHFLRADTSRRY